MIMFQLRDVLAGFKQNFFRIIPSSALQYVQKIQAKVIIRTKVNMVTFAKSLN